jgi:hypothetical protein
MAALFFMLPSNGRRGCKLDGGVNMTFARKLELGCGGVMGLLAVAILVTWVREEYAISVYLNRSPDLLQIVMGFILIILCPCFLVAYGSFLHAVKQRNLGKVLLVTGCSFIIGYFLLSIFSIAFIAVLESPLMLILWSMAIVTLIVSFVVEKQNKKAMSSS